MDIQITHIRSRTAFGDAGRPSRALRPHAARRGAALIIALVCLVLVTGLSAMLVRAALLQREQTLRAEWALQAEWLAEAALDRGVARSRQADYAGESWSPALSPGGETGRVEIVVERGDAPEASATLRVRVVADFPDDPNERVRVTKVVRVGGG